MHQPKSNAKSMQDMFWYLFDNHSNVDEEVVKLFHDIDEEFVSLEWEIHEYEMREKEDE